MGGIPSQPGLPFRLRPQPWPIRLERVIGTGPHSASLDTAGGGGGDAVLVMCHASRLQGPGTVISVSVCLTYLVKTNPGDILKCLPMLAFSWRADAKDAVLVIFVYAAFSLSPGGLSL